MCFSTEQIRPVNEWVLLDVCLSLSGKGYGQNHALFLARNPKAEMGPGSLQAHPPP